MRAFLYNMVTPLAPTHTLFVTVLNSSSNRTASSSLILVRFWVKWQLLCRTADCLPAVTGHH